MQSKREINLSKEFRGEKDIEYGKLPMKLNEKPMEELSEHYKERIECRICSEIFDNPSKQQFVSHVIGKHSIKGNQICDKCSRKVWINTTSKNMGL